MVKIDFFKKAKKATENFFDSECTIYIYKEIFNSEIGVTEFEEIPYLKNIPCRIIYKKINSAIQGRVSDYISQDAILIVSKNISIPEGSKISVISNGNVNFYQKSGSPAFYKTHQEIPIIIYKGFA